MKVFEIVIERNTVIIKIIMIIRGCLMDKSKKYDFFPWPLTLKS